MFCSSCGKKITENSKFCKYCGTSQVETEVKEEKIINKEDYETVWTCDFCKEEFKSKKESDSHELKCIQNPKNKKFLQNISPKRAWKYLWITTILVFSINLFIWGKYDKLNINLLNGEFLKKIFLSNIGLGVFSFLAIIISNDKPKNNKVSMFVKNSLIICFFYLLINSLVFAIEGNTAKNDENYRNKYYTTTTPTPVPTVEIKVTPTVTPKKTVNKASNTQNTNTKTNTNQGSQIDCIGPDGVQFKTTMEECKKLNETWGKPVDYMVNCNYSDLCAGGGGVRYVKKSECDKPCARKSNTGDSPNVYIPQNTTNNNTNKTAVFLTYSQYTIYCPSQNVGAVTTIDATMKSKSSEWAKNYNECTDRFRNTDTCWSSCKTAYNEGQSQCLSLYGYTGTEKETCSGKVGQDYSSCINKCPSPSSSCDYIYTEQKNLSSQITNLCR